MKQRVGQPFGSIITLWQWWQPQFLKESVVLAGSFGDGFLDVREPGVNLVQFDFRLGLGSADIPGDVEVVMFFS